MKQAAFSNKTHCTAAIRNVKKTKLNKQKHLSKWNSTHYHQTFKNQEKRGRENANKKKQQQIKWHCQKCIWTAGLVANIPQEIWISLLKVLKSKMFRLRPCKVISEVLMDEKML